MFARIARDVRKNESRLGLFDPEEIEDELGTACASRDHFEEMELMELNMMRLPSCVITLTVSDVESRETVLVLERQTSRNQLLPSDHFFFAVQILDAVGIGTEAPEVRKQVVVGIAAVWVRVDLSHSVTREHLREVLEPRVVQRRDWHL